MFKFLKSPEKLFNFSMWLVSFLFAGFLVGLGGKVIADLPSATKDIRMEDFANRTVLQTSRDTLNQADFKRRQLQTQRTEAQGVLDERRNAYSTAQSANRNWLATRSVTAGNPAALRQDPELLRQTQELERLNTALRQAQVGVEKIDAELRLNQRTMDDARSVQDEELERARPPYMSALRHQELVVFGYRLALALPLLAIAAWLIVKKRKSSHWPLARGFVVFAAFTFFFELVPYLPSYGGYVRYGVGILVSLVAGHYGIRWMQGYLVRRQEETKRNEQERRAQLDEVQAIQKIAAKVCPGCERQIPPDADGVKVNNCVYCGLKLFDICKNVPVAGGPVCGARKNAFYRHCPACGHSDSAAPRT